MPENFYDAIRLDRSAPPQILGIQLDDLIAQTKPGGHNQQFLLQAKAILSDPGKKAIYDQRLADPAAPPWSPQELHELAMAHLAPAGPAGPPPPPAPPSGPWPPQQHPSSGGDQFKQILAALPKWVIPAVAGALVLLLVIIIAASCGGGGGDSSTGPAARTSQSGAPSGERADLDGSGPPWPHKTNLKYTKWDTQKKARPAAQLVLTAGFDLPPAAEGATKLDPDRASIVQYQDRNVGVTISNGCEPGPYATGSRLGDQIAILDASGKLVSNNCYNIRKLDEPKPFDLQEMSTKGYFRITGGEGVSIPAAAGGTEPEMVYATALLPDAFDKNLVWIVLRGEDKLYKAEIR